MAFILRTISHSADGREIIRPARIEADKLTIGRDPNSDIHLTDLAVALHHATVERDGTSQLRLTTEAGVTVELNGRKTSSDMIELAQGGDIRIASHLLRIMPTAEGSDEIPIDVERITDGGFKISASDERQFSLAPVMPGKRASAWVFIFVVLALFLAWPIWSYYERKQEAVATKQFHADEMWLSGKLSLAHAGLAKDCKACHVTKFVAVRDDSCVACHTKIHDHADPFRLARARPDLGGFAKVRLAFQETFNLPPGRCVECHTEHEGPQQMPVTAQRFCSDCHSDLKAKLPDTKLPNAGDFGTSHPQFRPAVLTQWNGDRPMLQRVSLDAKPRENNGLKFPHGMHLSKTNGVAQMARRLSADQGFGQSLDCKDCHDPDPSGTRFQPVNMEEDCGMCHSLAFDRQGGTLRTLRHGEPRQVVADLRDFYRARPANPPATLGGMARRRPGDMMDIRGKMLFAQGTSPGRAEQAIRAVFSPGGACFDCHQIQRPPRGSFDFKVHPVAFPIRYMHKGWFDHKPHETQTCASCHNAKASNSASDLLLPDLDSCRTCHGGESAAKEVPSSCAMCHDYHMDEGSPSMLIRQRVRGKKRESSVASTEPGPKTGAR